MNQCQFCLRSTHHVDTCDDCREVLTRTGPTQKEEEVDKDYQIACLKNELKHKVEEIHNLLRQLDESRNVESTEPMVPANELRTAERRARFERAYMAALTGFCAMGSVTHENGQVEHAQPTAWAKHVALETVRQWDAMMAELDGEEGT